MDKNPPRPYLPARNTWKHRSSFVEYPTYDGSVSSNSRRLGPRPRQIARQSMCREILIADDSSAVRGALRNYLAERNFHVCGEAIDGQDAIQKTRELKPDLILLDLA